MNHSLLIALGVSHPSLNAIANMTDNLYHQMKSTTKLTGAGGGGCAFTFLEDDDTDNCNNNVETNNGNNAKSKYSSIKDRLRIVSEKIEALKSCESSTHNENKQVSSWSFQCFKSAVGGKGVIWH